MCMILYTYDWSSILTITVDLELRSKHLLIFSFISVVNCFHIPSLFFQNHWFIAKEIVSPSVSITDDDLSAALLFLKYFPFFTSKIGFGWHLQLAITVRSVLCWLLFEWDPSTEHLDLTFLFWSWRYLVVSGENGSLKSTRQINNSNKWFYYLKIIIEASYQNNAITQTWHQHTEA